MKKFFNNCEVKDFSEKIYDKEMDITITITINDEIHQVIIDCKIDDYADFSEIINNCLEDITDIYSISVTTNK